MRFDRVENWSVERVLASFTNEGAIYVCDDGKCWEVASGWSEVGRGGGGGGSIVKQEGH